MERAKRIEKQTRSADSKERKNYSRASIYRSLFRKSWNTKKKRLYLGIKHTHEKASTQIHNGSFQHRLPFIVIYLNFYNWSDWFVSVVYRVVSCCMNLRKSIWKIDGEKTLSAVRLLSSLQFISILANVGRLGSITKNILLKMSKRYPLMMLFATYWCVYNAVWLLPNVSIIRIKFMCVCPCGGTRHYHSFWQKKKRPTWHLMSREVGKATKRERDRDKIYGGNTTITCNFLHLRFNLHHSIYSMFSIIK